MTKQTNQLLDKPENHQGQLAEDYMGSDHGLVNVIDEDDDDIDDEDDLDVDEIDVIEGDDEDGVTEVVPTDDDIDDDLSLEDDDDDEEDDI
jgi:hypothetical protein